MVVLCSKISCTSYFSSKYDFHPAEYESFKKEPSLAFNNGLGYFREDWVSKSLMNFDDYSWDIVIIR